MNRNHRRRNRRRSSGFTLMEVLLVLAILVILGAFAVSSFTGVFAKAKIDAAKTQVDLFVSQMDYYYMHVGTYPSSQQGLAALRQAPPDLPDPAKWHGPYAKTDIPPDPWSNNYVYELISPTQFKVYSVGPDGQQGTEDDIVTVSG